MRLSRLLEITEVGLPTAWVPRASMLVELLEADEADRPGVFADRCSEVIEDCKTVLNDITSPELADLVELLNEALDVAHNGRMAAAQALAASISDTILRKTFPGSPVATTPRSRPKSRTGTRTPRSPRCRGVSCICLRWSSLSTSGSTRAIRFPKKFNRHASAHAVGRAQYTNAVIALALATPLVREAHQVIVDNVAEAA